MTSVSQLDELRAKLASDREEREEIFEYLRAEIHNKNAQINDLTEKNAGLVEEQERITQEHERTQQVRAAIPAGAAGP